MYNQEEHIELLWQLFVANRATPAQVRDLLEYIQNPTHDAANLHMYRQVLGSGAMQPEQGEDDGSRSDAWQRLLAADESLRQATRQTPARMVRLRWLYRAAAAAAVILLAWGGWWWNQKHSRQSLTPSAALAVAADVPPGHNGAILQLAGGQRIVLDSAANGVIAREAGIAIKKENGALAYAAQPATAPAVQNTLSTPRGRQFRLWLPDGSRVWLNAASSISYPVAFNGHERRVRLSGEAYFEIAENKEKPFTVEVTGKALVEVLGTHFNVNGYDDEQSIRTTLLEGKVKVLKPGNAGEALLRPGQQAAIPLQERLNGGITVEAVDTDKVIAWKNGLFNLENSDVPSLMRQLERWYDIRVQYTGPVPARSFHGKINREATLSAVLRWLQEVGIPNRAEGRTVIIGAH